MSEPMSIETAVTGLMVITPKLASVLVWVVFIVSHLFLMVFGLALLWWYQVSPTAIQGTVSQFFQSSPASTIAGSFAFLGLSGGGVLWAYAKIWRWLLHKMLSSFLFAS